MECLRKVTVFYHADAINYPGLEARGFLAQYTAIASSQPATADIAPGDHSSPGLEAMGFSGQFYKGVFHLRRASA